MTSSPALTPLSRTATATATTTAQLALAGLTTLTLALAGCNNSQSAPVPGASRPTPVGVQTLQAEKVDLSVELAGRTTSPLVAEIRPQVGGIIQARRFTEGATVKAGQVLYQIDAASYQAAYASAQANVAKAEAVVQADKLTAQRRAELVKIDAISQQDSQDAQAALDQAQADLAVARAALETARINLGRTAIVSPIGGLVDVSAATPGALVTAEQTTALTTVRQIDPIQVDITQSSADLLRLTRDLSSGRLQGVAADEASVKLVLEDGSTYARAGKLRFRGVSVNTSTGTVTLRAVFANPEGLLLPGMYVRAVLQTGAANQALLVPQQAVSRESNGAASVLVVDAQNKVQKRTVTTDRQVGNRWLVTAGLKAGERVVVEGSLKVRPGDVVQPEPVALAGPASAASAASTASATTSVAAR